MLISDHSSFRVLLDKIASVYFNWKIYLYFSIVNGQPREPALCQLYRHTFVPYAFVSVGRLITVEERSTVVYICLSVCASVCEHMSGITRPIFAIFSACYLLPWLDPPWGRCDMLCTSGFMDDVMFARIWHRNIHLNWATRGHVRGRSLLSTNALLNVERKRLVRMLWEIVRLYRIILPWSATDIWNDWIWVTTVYGEFWWRVDIFRFFVVSI